jgi:hypothetical protein
MHAAGVQFDHAFLVGQATEPDRVVVGIVLWPFYHSDAGLERVAAAFQEGVSRFGVCIAVVRADDDWAFRGIFFGRVALLAVFGERAWNGRVRSHPGGNGSEHGRLHEITA